MASKSFFISKTSKYKQHLHIIQPDSNWPISNMAAVSTSRVFMEMAGSAVSSSASARPIQNFKKNVNS